MWDSAGKDFVLVFFAWFWEKSFVRVVFFGYCAVNCLANVVC